MNSLQGKVLITSKKDFESWLVKILAEWQKVPSCDIDKNAPFRHLGIRAKKTIELTDLINQVTYFNITPTIFFQYPTITDLVNYLFEKKADDANIEIEQHSLDVEPIAIIGMAARASGANNLDEYWDVIENGKVTTRTVEQGRWDHNDYYDADPNKPGKISSKLFGFIDYTKEFDSDLFKISNTELVEIDPQQRVLLELSWEALEHACYAPDQMTKKKVGVYIGIHNNDYLRMNLKDTNKISPYTITGGALSVAAGRISYQFGFTGPSMSIDTACSSSLIAIHLACQSLRLRESSMCVAGGINLIFSSDFLIGLTKARMLSPTGACHTFSDEADGYARSEGAGIVILKRLQDAVADDDNILAVIRSSSVNQDGRSNGLTAPNKTAQIAVISHALHLANLSPDQIDYVEAHGSGTLLGDLIELEALDAVFQQNASVKSRKVVIGSVKPNIGHTETAAGVLGLIKIVLALQNQSIPAHTLQGELTSLIAWDSSRLCITNKNQKWSPDVNKKRYAGISSFGFSGTNIHMIIEEPPRLARSQCVDHPTHENILFISAANKESLVLLAHSYAQFLTQHKEIRLVDLCYTALRYRAKLPVRLAISAREREEVINCLQNLDADSQLIVNKRKHLSVPKIVFMFSNFSYFNRQEIANLYHDFDCFKKALLQCDHFLRHSEYYNGPLITDYFKSNTEQIHIDRPGQAQLFTFCLHYALFQLLNFYHINPDFILASNANEYAASCAAGVMSWEDGLLASAAFYSSSNIEELDEARIASSSPQVSLFLTDDFINTSFEDIESVREFIADKDILFIDFGSELDVYARNDEIIHLTLIPLAVKSDKNFCEILARLLAYDVSAKVNCYGKKIIGPTYSFLRQTYWKIPQEKVIAAAQVHHNVVVQDVPRAHQINNVEAYVFAQLSEILNIELEKLQGHLQVTHYGFDSLMSLHLKNRIAHDYGIEIAITSIINSQSIDDFIDDLKLQLSTNNIENLSLIDSQNTSCTFKLSNTQKQLWFLQQLATQSAAYVIPIAIKLEGDVNIEVLEFALNILLQTYEILRINICVDKGEPYQVVRPYDPIVLTKINFDQTVDQTIEQVLNIACDLAMQPFNLENELLFRSILIRVNDNCKLLVFIFHHIIIDGWSLLEIFLPQLFSLYNQYLSTKSIQTLNYTQTLNQKLSYQTYVLNEEQELKYRLNKNLSYWCSKLAEANYQPLLGTDYLRPQNTAFKGRRCSIPLSGPLSSELDRLSRSINKTVFSILLSVLYCTVYRWSDENDLIIGTTFANRASEQLKNTLGDFTNHLPIRIVIDDEITINAFIKQVSDTILEAFDHAYCPIQKIIDKLNLVRIGNRNPLYNIACVMHPFIGLTNTWQLENHAVASFVTPSGQIDNGTSEIDLLIEIVRNGTELILECEYDIEIFDPATIELFFDCYKFILSQIIANPSMFIHELDNVSKQALLPKKNCLHCEDPTLQPIHKIFEQQVFIRPHAVALVYENAELSYEELNKLCNQVAQKLLLVGVKPKELIALYIERSFAMIFSILGILKAGCSYLPIDTEYPNDYVESIIIDSKTKYLICSELNADRKFLSYLHLTIIETTHLSVPVGGEKISVNVDLEDTAYVIYTSGSTGKPKGVCVSHKNVVRLFKSTENLFRFNNSDVWTLFHSYAFDFSVWEILGALLYGGKLIILPYVVTRTPSQVFRMLLSHKVTVFNQTPSAFKQFLEYYSSLNLRAEFTLRYIIFGGEALDIYILNSWMAKHGLDAVKLINMYGITEITVHASYKILSGHSEYCNSIGRPLPDLEIYIFDRRGKPLPAGAIGEIYIKGPGVAQGYLNNPNLTEQRFIRINSDTSRVYRTGDKGRYLPNGEISYLGRIDDQIKIRGHRIELGHIEAILKSHELVRDCIATLESMGEDKVIFSYIVPDIKRLTHDTDNLLLQWKSIFNSTYSDLSYSTLSHLNYVGWKSSYTNKTLSQKEMEEWVEDSVNDILTLEPKHVLEIGCGTGMVLFKLLEHCDSYTATDLSETAIHYVSAVLKEKRTSQDRLHLYIQPADDFSHLEFDKYDVVILNSVAQYFPSIDYFTNFITKITPYIARGGYCYIGDIRHFNLQKLFYSSVEYHKAADYFTVSQMKQNVSRRTVEENELLIAPSFFYKIVQNETRLTEVYTKMRDGIEINEMNKFRYNTILCYDRVTVKKSIKKLTFEDITLKNVETMLSKNKIKEIFISKIPNSRLQRDNAVMRLLECSHEYLSKKDLETTLFSIDDHTNDLDELIMLFKKHDFTIKIMMNLSDPTHAVDCYLLKRNNSKVPGIPRHLLESVSMKSVDEDSNVIPFKLISSQMTNSLKKYVASRLPLYMLPVHYFIVNHFEMTLNGKINKKALPKLDKAQSFYEIVVPQNAIEQWVIENLQELLTVNKLSMSDCFFNIGGNSIIATQFVSRVRSELDIEMSLAYIFTNPTLAELASIILNELAIETGHPVRNSIS